MFPTVPLTSIPTLSTSQMVEVDRVMIDDLGITLIQMMENAGRNLARLTMERYINNGGADGVVVLAGSGGNGGGGIVAARRLAGWGVPVSVVLSKPADRYSGVVAHQLETLVKIGVGVDADGLPPTMGGHSNVVIDALIGYSLAGTPRGRIGELIRWACEADTRVVSLDVPSGIDATTGEPHDPAITADVTLTLALVKSGLLAGQAAEHVGDLYVADIAVPASLYRRSFGIEVGDLFASSDIVRVDKLR
jgi:NAD(P)H-hydrate epimerase